MNGLVLLAIACSVFAAGYFLYSRFIGRVLGIDPRRPTPAHTRRDGVDYVPAHPTVLFGHHFAAIAGAGPIVGPVLAAEFGWASVALWIILGCTFIGAAHDMISLFLSVRHDGQSIGSVIGSVLGRQGRILFLLFSWSALVLVVAEFTRQIAATFVADPAIATASLLFIAEAILFGLCVYRFRMSVMLATLIFVPLMFAFVWIGNLYPFDLVKMLGLSADQTRVVWTLVLLVYCFFASTCPVWILLQPRDYRNAYRLYAMMALGILGVAVAHPVLNTDAFVGLSGIGRSGVAECLFPFLFVTVACGACSGFHALVASGTSAKQLDSEKGIRPIAYGGMLLEGVLATIALIGVAGTFASQQDYVSAVQAKEPVQLFASSIAGFCVKIGIPQRIAESFMLLSVSAFLMTTVDAGTRLARFSFQELAVAAFDRDDEEKAKAAPSAGFKLFHNMYAGTALVVALAAALLLASPKAAKSLWTIFASANQLLAALTLLTATLWLLRKRLNFWITLVPMAFMLVTSGTAVGQLFLKNLDAWIKEGFAAGGITAIGAALLFVIAVVLVALGVARVRKIVNKRILESIAR